ncbi:hypothetical protein SAMN05428952_1001137 [Nitrosomonas sp. Nm132]|nr:hypothetical protein SAMN05428952_1001137 [Nitrosomonas sp. Nm132]
MNVSDIQIIKLRKMQGSRAVHAERPGVLSFENHDIILA